MITARIDIRGIHGFLTASSKLRDIVGANVLLGHAMRIHLRALAAKYAAPIDSVHESLLGQLWGAGANVPGAHIVVDDDPCSQIRQGILSRDGGHFIVVVSWKPVDETGSFERCDDWAKASDFLQEASRLLEQEAPGLRHDTEIVAYDANGNRVDVPERWMIPRSITEVVPFGGPWFADCESSVLQPAVQRSKPKGLGAQAVPVSRAIAVRQSAYDVFRAGKASDIASLIYHHVASLSTFEGSTLGLEDSETLDRLCGSDDLAVIHADGNSLGKKSLDLVKGKHGFAADVLREQFFHGTRSMLRLALVEALQAVFDRPVLDVLGSSGPSPTKPFQILMLGGDDLLIVMRARHAFPFVVELASALVNHEATFSLGFGVAIAPPRTPVHGLVAQAEALASSAKRLYKAIENTDGVEASVVDWHVETGSSTVDPFVWRRQNAVVDANTVLSRRPLRVLPQQDERTPRSLDSLKSVLDAARDLQQRLKTTEVRSVQAATTQIYHLLAEMAKGVRAGETAFARLADAAGKETGSSQTGGTLGALGSLGITSPWLQAPSTRRGQPRLISQLHDLWDVYRVLHRSQRETR